MKQKTIKNYFTISGIGVHTGVFSTVTLCPAPENTGIVLVNKKVPGDQMTLGSIIPEAAPHATVIKSDKWAVSTVEHLMAALWALDIDNLIIQLDGFMTEVPILDGSAYPFLQLIQQEGGVVEQEAQKKFIIPKREISIKDEKGRFFTLSPHKNESSQSRLLAVDYTASFDYPLLGEQAFTGVVTGDFFEHELSPARTFGFLEQLPMLREHSLALGCSLGNSVVMNTEGLLNQLRFDDEHVRHKVLDLIGDLALLGGKLVGNICARKTGHSFNRNIIEYFIKHPDAWAWTV